MIMSFSPFFTPNGGGMGEYGDAGMQGKGGIIGKRGTMILLSIKLKLINFHNFAVHPGQKEDTRNTTQ